jgi:hypothetical protein
MAGASFTLPLPPLNDCASTPLAALAVLEKVMDKKVLGYVSVALLACCALMLTVIGGLYAYNTFAGSANPVYAAGTDKGPDWTVTSLLIDQNNEYIVVVTRTKNPIDDSANPESLQIACYQLRARGSEGKAELFFVAARTITYDLRLEWANDKQLGGSSEKIAPREIKKILDKQGK